MKRRVFSAIKFFGLLGFVVLLTGCPSIFGGEDPDSGYSVEYNENGAEAGSVPIDSQLYQEGDQVVVIGNTGNLAKPGFTFGGWNTEAQGSGASYSGGDTFLASAENIVLYAQWEGIPSTYAVQYHGNGADGGEPPAMSGGHQDGAMVTVAETPTGFSREGYGFLGWNTEVDGSGTLYAPGDDLQIQTADITLYAQWFALVADVGVGYDHTLIVKTDGTLLAMGRNADGELGLGDTADRLLPTLVPIEVAVTAASAGLSHSLIVDGGGFVLASGSNSVGQLGLGDLDERHTFTALSGISNGLDVQATYAFSTLLTSDGTVFGMGQNQYGQITDGTTTNKSSPSQAPGITDATAISSRGWAQSHTIILTSSGTAYGVGANHSGQLGVGDSSTHNTPAEVLSLTDIVAISTGGFHTMFLTADGTLYGTGYNTNGQLGLGSGFDGTDEPYEIMSDVAAVSAGDEYTMIIAKDGTLLATGLNDDGQLGLGHVTTVYEPLPVMSDVAAVYAGVTHTLIVKEDGTLWATGENTWGQLGDGTQIIRTSPVQIDY